MINEPSDFESNPAEAQRRVDAIVARGPGGAFAVAGVALALMMAIWLAFYFLVFVARGGTGE
jgi:asparagine N-glycosylation enzyme membrane subunit Stt3